MKDEIKEILEALKLHNDIVKEYPLTLSIEEQKILLDYITNLQEENKRLKEIIENLTTMTVNGDRTQIKNTAQYKLDIYKSRNEKAIEYIKSYKNDYAPYELSDYNIRELLNILNGDDEE